MSKITKPNFTDVWSSAGSKTTPSSLKIQTGWVGEKPPYEYWNWAMNRNDVGAAYSFQMGIAEWDSTVEYQYSASYKSYIQRNGLVYKALQTGTNKNPLTQPTYWALAFDDYGSASTVQTNLNTHITNYGTLASLSNVATARTNLDVYSKGEGDARYAALAGLDTQVFSAADGVSGKNVVNKDQLDTKAPKYGDVAINFDVATATSGNQAVTYTQFTGKTGQATETVAGISEICTDAELLAGSSDTVVATPLKLRLGFAASFAARGYVAFPTWLGGVVIQWGAESPIAVDQSYTFPMAFPTACYSIVCSPNSSAGIHVECVGFSALNASGFNANTSEILSGGGGAVNSFFPFWWMAIGK